LNGWFVVTLTTANCNSRVHIVDGCNAYIHFLAIGCFDPPARRLAQSISRHRKCAVPDGCSALLWLFQVTPIVGFITEETRQQLKSNEEEVECVFDAPLEMFLHHSSHHSHRDVSWTPSICYRMHYFTHEYQRRTFKIWVCFRIITDSSLVCKNVNMFDATNDMRLTCLNPINQLAMHMRDRHDSLEFSNIDDVILNEICC
jgi:hypothetical protein